MSGVAPAGRYLLVGAASALLVNATVIGLDAAGVHYALGSITAFLWVGTASYGAHCRWTFGANPGWMGYARFMAGLTAGAVWSLALMMLGVSLLGLPVALVSPVVTVLITGWNYVAARWAIVARPAPESAR